MVVKHCTSSYFSRSPMLILFDYQRENSIRAGVWNHLDLEVKQASSFKAFKDAVKR